ncbi:MAG: alpha/beta fold hydrolase [Arcanobacterium sp.]|nr:alpha/beta fold hydrolase [Arcanobacterium sp.]
MKLRKVTISVLAVLGLSVSTLTAVAADEPTIDNPGGIPALTSPDGIPAQGDGPDRHTAIGAQTLANQKPGLNPLGANNFSCKPKPGQNPIILIPGTSGTAYGTWAFMAPHLTQAGFCVYSFNYNVAMNPRREAMAFTGDIRQSAAFLAGFVDRVRAATGAEKVDLIGHSQGGGVLPRAYIKWFGGESKVAHLIGLSPSNNGTSMMGMKNLIYSLLNRYPQLETNLLNSANQQALLQQLDGSKFLAELNAGGLTKPGIKYTVISTKLDTVITPYTKTFINEAGVSNKTIQDFCPAAAANHGNITYSPVAFQLVLAALNADTLRQIRCLWIPPYLKAQDIR